jgi:hypothetical protein
VCADRISNKVSKSSRVKWTSMCIRQNVRFVGLSNEYSVIERSYPICEGPFCRRRRCGRVDLECSTNRVIQSDPISIVSVSGLRLLPRISMPSFDFYSDELDSSHRGCYDKQNPGNYGEGRWLKFIRYEFNPDSTLCSSDIDFVRQELLRLVKHSHSSESERP